MTGINWDGLRRIGTLSHGEERQLGDAEQAEINTAIARIRNLFAQAGERLSENAQADGNAASPLEQE